MSTEILEKIFNSPYRVKIIRLFFLNPQELFAVNDIAVRTKTPRNTTRKELLMLKKISFIKRVARGKKEGLQLNPSFLLSRPLKNLVLNSAPFSNKEIIKRFKMVGRLKLMIISGIFLQNEENSRVDLFIVADQVKKSLLKKALKNIEAKIGKELEYSVMSSQEFQYRLGMYDKFMRDIFDSPHEKVINKLNI
ncbi:MAG: hypothetical protein A2909_03115 [Candidatus Tagabacteria bacterium RIFCSPLOWO2_01_FULL_39_11]|uniref:HTH arsR-type domain-containing protein n=1 Tax=Candidatus Tagabacteria bacterium RIFCSPLOWO2_01_FULL_39_11 TaxID=1802295 RepID=A0A1G2LR46_9BACT|nr:MAG: hypothetical protein A2909_03115 [Candidatus Tagabacteria bacterium RIFCSPLOWO2_01_FULL_39_11]